MAFLLALGLALTSIPVAIAKESAIELLGRLPEDPQADGATTYVLDVDPQRQRMLYLWRLGPRFLLREYDIGPDVPRLVREEQIGTYDEFQLDVASPYTVSVDRSRRLILFQAPNFFGTAIRVVDAKTFRVTGSWELSTAVPGFFAEGMSYSEEDDRLYLVGGFYGEAHIQRLAFRRPASATMVVALDMPREPGGSPSLAWTKPIDECQTPLSNTYTGALIARSGRAPVLYFACVRPDPFPGQSGLVRLHIDPDADLAAARDFRVDLFPISGSYTSQEGLVGAAAFDVRSDRFFVQSVAPATPGTWVFDGRLSAWVGFVAAPDAYNRYLGLDQETGRFYMASGPGSDEGGYLLITDGRATPIPQGTVYRGWGTSDFIATDPASDRLFAKMVLGKLGLGAESERGFVVLRDRTPVPKRPRPIEHDSLTVDRPEGKDTVTSYSSGANGFGARAVIVGGYGGVVSAGGTPIGIGQLRPGDRGVTAARLPSVDLREVGASATAHAFVPDSNTEAELSDTGSDGLPWQPVSCLDGSGEPLSEEDVQPAGSARVKCNLAENVVEATAVSGRLDPGVVSVARSAISASARRDPERGTVTEITAVAEGIEIVTPQGTLAIGKVASKAVTGAHGRPGTAEAEWRRVVSGVELRDGEGEVVEQLGSCDSADEEESCGDLEEAINSVLPARMRLELPHPQVQATPRGAFAGVQQGDSDFFHNRTVNNQGAVFEAEGGSRALPGLQLTVFNDTQEKSRLLLQLAAVQANSIYTISLRQDPSDEPARGLPISVEVPDTGGAVSSVGGDGLVADEVDLSEGEVDLPDDAALDDAGLEGAPVEAAQSPVGAAGPLKGVTAFLRRSPQEALLVGMVWLLFAGAGWTVFRRYQLLDILGGAKR